jgi:N-acyl homoserine lactone hydrolase
MKTGSWLILAGSLAATSCTMPMHSTSTGVERLYVMDCGEGPAGDLSRWTPGLNAGKSVPFVDNCYLIKHAQGWMLWDTGITDAVAAMPEGLKPADPRSVWWHRSKTLAAQLAEVGVKPADIKYVGVSHSHPDHMGNTPMFPQSTLVVQKAEYEWPQQDGKPRFLATLPVMKLEGDRDVFGDGSVVVLATPGHTPGHQSLLVRLPRTGAVVLSGDLVHFKDNWDNRRVPAFNTDQAASATSMSRVADVLAKEHATLWINHDKPQRDTLKMSPAYYD